MFPSECEQLYYYPPNRVRVDTMDEDTDAQKEKSRKDSKKDKSIRMPKFNMPSIRSLKRGI